MTPEELNQTVEFIIQSQARLAAAQEQDRQDRPQFEEWSKGLSNQVVRLLDIQSRRLDRMDKFYENSVKHNRQFQSQMSDFQGQVTDFQNQSLEFHKQTLRLLNLILDRLPLRPKQ